MGVNILDSVRKATKAKSLEREMVVVVVVGGFGGQAFQAAF